MLLVSFRCNGLIIAYAALSNPRSSGFQQRHQVRDFPQPIRTSVDRGPCCAFNWRYGYSEQGKDVSVAGEYYLQKGIVVQGGLADVDNGDIPKRFAARKVNGGVRFSSIFQE